MSTDYWLDFFEELREFMDINTYLLLFIGRSGYKGKIPSTKFWGATFLFYNFLWSIEVKIVMKDGHILTPQDCINEMEDCYIEEKEERSYQKFMEGLVR